MKEISCIQTDRRFSGKISTAVHLH